MSDEVPTNPENPPVHSPTEPAPAMDTPPPVIMPLWARDLVKETVREVMRETEDRWASSLATIMQASDERWANVVNGIFDRFLVALKGQQNYAEEHTHRVDKSTG